MLLLFVLARGSGLSFAAAASLILAGQNSQRGALRNNRTHKSMRPTQLPQREPIADTDPQ